MVKKKTTAKNTSVLNERYLVQKTSKEVEKEMKSGIAFLQSINHPIITFFGSHTLSKTSPDYKNAYAASRLLAKKGYAIMSGGGPGIMHAANAGAMREHVPSIGVMADMLIEERIKDTIFTHKAAYKYMFVRRFILSIKSEALVFYPGGFGTLNELFEFLVLIQTKMVDKVPIILVNTAFWKGLDVWMKKLPSLNLIKKTDLDLLHYAETPLDVVKIIEKL